MLDKLFGCNSGLFQNIMQQTNAQFIMQRDDAAYFFFGGYALF